jgi:hypothetical protein
MMKPCSSVPFFVLLIAVLVTAVAGIGWRQRQTAALRDELAAVSRTAHELARLRTENVRLREKQIPAAELEALRADHAALPRLRAEIEALRKQK